MLGIQPRAAGWEAKMPLLCYVVCTPHPHVFIIHNTLIAQSNGLFIPINFSIPQQALGLVLGLPSKSCNFNIFFQVSVPSWTQCRRPSTIRSRSPIRSFPASGSNSCQLSATSKRSERRPRRRRRPKPRLSFAGSRSWSRSWPTWASSRKRCSGK